MKTTKCNKCKQEISNNNYQKHIKSCNGTIKKHEPIQDEWKQSNGKYKCPHCDEEYVKNGISTHIFRKHTEIGKSMNTGFDFKEYYKTHDSWRKGLTKETNEDIRNAALKISKTVKQMGTTGNNNFQIYRKKYPEEWKQACSRGGGLRRGSGRGKKGWYKGYWCDSSWELAFVIYNLEHNIKFERNREGFPYIFENKEYNYYPDFIVDGKYVEVKGYEDAKAIAKKEQFKHEIITLKSKGIKKYLDYVINKYGKNFIELYT